MHREQLSADVWFCHDPQLLPLARLMPRERKDTWIWICHLDLTAPSNSVLGSLLPLTKYYDTLVFTLDRYVPDGLAQAPPVYIAPPAIDPLAVKRYIFDRQRALELVTAMGVDPARPLVSQVSRFDT